MESIEVRKNAQRLLAARDQKLQIAAPRISSRETAFAVQTEIARLAGGLGVWKIATLPQDGELVFAPILKESVVNTAIVYPPSVFHMIGVEGEIVVQLGPAILAASASLERDAILAVVTDVRAGIEIVDTRIRDWRNAPKLALIADNMCSGGLVLGAPLPDWRSIDLAAPGFTLSINGVIASAPSRNPAGDIFHVIGRLLDHCRAFGLDLPAGTLVTTGSSTGMVFASEGDHVALNSGDRVLAEATFSLLPSSENR